jgi:hypothetical protein
MPPDHRLQPLIREARTLGRNLVFHHHRRGRGQARSYICLSLIIFPGFDYGFYVKSVLSPQPGYDLVQPLSGQAAGIVHKYPDF